MLLSTNSVLATWISSGLGRVKALIIVDCRLTGVTFPPNSSPTKRNSW